MANLLEREVLDVKIHHVSNLLRFFRNNTYIYSQHTSLHTEILELVEVLWSLDYKCMKISNDGKYCDQYPATLLVPDKHMRTMFKPIEIELHSRYSSENFHNTTEYTPLGDDPQKKAVKQIKKEILEKYREELGVSPLSMSEFQAEKSLEEKAELLRKKFEDAQYGRSRKRFVMPTILYKNKYIARSATVPLTKEIMLRIGLDGAYKVRDDAYQYAYSIRAMIMGSDIPTNPTKPLDAGSLFDLPNLEDLTKLAQHFTTEEGLKILNKFGSYAEEQMKADRKLLESCKIRNIFDLMVEEGKVKYWTRCSSSEVAAGDAYASFKINAVPYPGCEFFAQFKRNDRRADQLVFDWQAAEVTKEFFLENEELNCVQSNWNYKEWPLTHMTSVYLMLMLKSLKDSPAPDGILVHCISGWDRTPLFISLLRISLWADGEIHQSLNSMQMLYFTLSWDWMFFGHSLANRETKGEQIMYFCFYFLKFIKCENFNTTSPSFGTLKDYESDLMKGDEMLQEMVTPKKPKLLASNEEFEKVSVSEMPGYSSEEVTPEKADRKAVAADRILKKADRYRRITELRGLFHEAYHPVMIENDQEFKRQCSLSAYIFEMFKIDDKN